ncbi:MAG: thioredoxin-disulfide reductase [Paludibacteraceae bacterium]|nr:thioredoxin-disulfide reductase [Paludibacteraceae bacterium]
MNILKCLIIGSGPAGLTAAIYASRAGLSPVVYEGMQPGGQLTQTTEIENFPGYPNGTTGTEMMEDLHKQAARFGAEINWGIATKVDFSKRPFSVTIDDANEVLAHTVIIATGASAKYLGIADEQKYAGNGVSACATCDGFFYRKKTVAVVGGGDTACEEALYLASLCKKVYLIVRRNVLRASQVMQQRVFDAENIEVLFEHQTLGLTGDGVVEGANLVKFKGTDKEEQIHIDIDGFFLGIGHQPNSEVFKPYIETDAAGYILTQGKSQQTNIEGIYAAGDVADPTYRQAITSAGTGCKAAIEAERYLRDKGI